MNKHLIDILLTYKLGLKRGTVDFLAYEPLWEDAFKLISNLIYKFLPEVEIHHVGSTALPNSIAKPILDILIVFKEESVFINKINKFEELGFIYRGDYGIESLY